MEILNIINRLSFKNKTKKTLNQIPQWLRIENRKNAKEWLQGNLSKGTEKEQFSNWIRTWRVCCHKSQIRGKFFLSYPNLEKMFRVGMVKESRDQSITGGKG